MKPISEMNAHEALEVWKREKNPPFGLLRGHQRFEQSAARLDQLCLDAGLVTTSAYVFFKNFEVAKDGICEIHQEPRNLIAMLQWLETKQKR